MAALPPLYPTSMVSAGGWTDEAGGSTNLHLVVDETSNGDTDYIRTPTNATADLTIEFSDMPFDFVFMNTLSIEVRHSRGGVEGGDAGGGDDTWDLFAYITDSSGTIALAGGNSVVGNGQTINTSTVGYVTKTDTAAFTYVNPATTRAEWNTARLVLEGVFSLVSTNDADRIWVDYVRLVNGTYTATVTPSGTPVWLTHFRP